MKTFIEYINEAKTSQIINLTIDGIKIPYEISLTRLVVDEPLLIKISDKLNTLILAKRSSLATKNIKPEKSDLYLQIINDILVNPKKENFEKRKTEVDKKINEYKEKYPKTPIEKIYIIFLIDVFKHKS